MLNLVKDKYSKERIKKDIINEMERHLNRPFGEWSEFSIILPGHRQYTVQTTFKNFDQMFDYFYENGEDPVLSLLPFLGLDLHAKRNPKEEDEAA